MVTARSGSGAPMPWKLPTRRLGHSAHYPGGCHAQEVETRRLQRGEPVLSGLPTGQSRHMAHGCENRLSRRVVKECKEGAALPVRPRRGAPMAHRLWPTTYAAAGRQYGMGPTTRRRSSSTAMVSHSSRYWPMAGASGSMQPQHGELVMHGEVWIVRTRRDPRGSDAGPGAASAAEGEVGRVEEPTREVGELLSLAPAPAEGESKTRSRRRSRRRSRACRGV